MEQDRSEATATAAQARLLRTKLYVPRVHPDLVPRDRLARRLDEGQACRLTLLSAPAGFGKTTLLGDWLRRRDLHPAWVSLDAGDDEPGRFWSYVVAALDGVLPGVGREASALLSSPQPPPTEAILTGLCNDIAERLEREEEGDAVRAGGPVRQGPPLLLILDDYHAIQNPAIHRALEFLVLNLPPQMRLIVASREDPVLPLALLRGRRELLELRAADLRFTASEAAAFLNTCMGLDLTADNLAALADRTEGWAAGLQLAALSMQGVDDVAGFIRAFTGSHRYVFDYLAQEVLAQQPPAIRDFLLHTAILERLCGPLCNALTGTGDGQARLEQLEQANLFLLPLDQERHWYRYHALFAEFLRLHLVQSEGQERVAALHRQAAAWYEAQGAVEDAVQHALLAADFDTALRLIESQAEVMFVRSELVTLCRWLAGLPAETIAARPRLSMLYAWALVATGRGEEAERWVEAIERQVGAGVEALAPETGETLTAQVRAALVEVSVLRGSLAMGRGDLPRVQELIQRVLPYLAAEEQPALFNTPRALRPAALFTLAVSYEIGGEPARAVPVFAQAAELGVAESNHHLVPMALSHLARLQIVQGQLRQAERTYHQALDASEKMTKRASPLAGMAYTGLGGLLYEWNDLEAARSYLTRGIALARPWLNWDSLLPGHLILARLQRAQGDEAGADETLAAFFRLEGMPLPPQAAGALAALQALFQAQAGDLDAAERWAATCDLDIGHDVPLFREDEAIILARIRLMQNRPAEAVALLEWLAAAATAAGRNGRLIEILALQALVSQAQGQSEAAVQALCRALELAAPEGWVRTFVDEGSPMAELLERVGSRCLPDYVARLVAALRPAGSSTSAGSASAPAASRADSVARDSSAANEALIEPLTGRELDVLQLMAAGLSNRDIAGRLVVSVNTVKTHAKNLNAKLGAANRTQAVARARELGLLDNYPAT